jgi:hypothetical protein
VGDFPVASEFYDALHTLAIEADTGRKENPTVGVLDGFFGEIREKLQWIEMV